MKSNNKEQRNYLHILLLIALKKMGGRIKFDRSDYLWATDKKSEIRQRGNWEDGGSITVRRQ